jgi:hypothetical protein
MLKYKLGLALITSILFSFSSFAQSPGGVSGNLHGWWKTDAGLTGSPVTAWTDQSGNGFNMSATVGPTVETNELNFRSTLDFDGANDYMQITGGIYGVNTFNDMWVYAVTRQDVTQASNLFFETLNGGDRFGAHVTWSDQNVYYDHGTCCGSSRINVNWGTSTGIYHLWTLGSSNGTATPSGTRKSIYRDGLSIVTNNNNDTGTGNNSNFFFGSSSAAGGFFNGNIAEAVIYQGVPSATDQHKIHSYLSLRHGLTMDQSTATSYVSSSNTNIYASQAAGAHDSYDNDITGIGRDDNSGFDQRMAITSNSGARVIMDKGGAFAGDEDFIVWGNDGASTAAVTTDVHPTTTYRVNRIWRADLTGTPGNVSVRFILGAGITNSGVPGDYALLYDSDTDFSDGTAHTVGASISGDTLTFTGVGFTDGDFFTLGTEYKVIGPGGYASTMLAWWKGDQGITGAAPVTQWDDQSGNGQHLTAGTGPDELTDINYESAMNFNGTNESMVVTGGITGTSVYNDMFIVAMNKTNTVQASTAFRETMSGGDRFGSHLAWSNSNVYWDYGTCCGGGGRINGAWGTSAGNYHIWTMASSTGTATSTGTRKSVHRDGGELLTGNGNDNATGAGNDFFLGSSTGPSSFHAGNIAEFVAFGSNPSAAELQQIHSYFAMKYGITLDNDNNSDGTAFQAPNADGINEGDYLDAGGNQIWDGSDNTGYHQNIIAIARDDDQALMKKQAQTPDDSSRVYISALAADNAANAGTFIGDAEFLIVGDDGAQMCGTAGSMAEMPGSQYSRMEREWKVTNTNFNGTFSVDWSLAACADLSSITTAHLTLLVDTDGDFSNATVYDATDGLTFSNAAGRITIAGITIGMVARNSTRYITLGTISALTPLPIELVSFDAFKSGSTTRLEWSTASEISNAFFTIERSKNASDWETVLVVDGAGNSSELLYYTERDHTPYNGINYYRLKQTDFNGDHTYSGIKAVEFTDEIPVLNIYPNPAENFVTIQSNSDIVSIRLMNIEGKILTEASPNTNAHTINTDFLSSGMYILSVKTGNSTIQKRLAIR